MSKLELTAECSGATGRLVCVGRIIAGDEVEELDSALQDLLLQADSVEIDLAAVTFLDSSGLGVLVRNLMRAREHGRKVRITGMSDQVRNTLKITNVLELLVSGASAPSASLHGLRLLFTHSSAEIRTFIAALLKRHGATVVTCASMYDARIVSSPEDIDLLILAEDVETPDAMAGKVLRLPTEFFDGPAEVAGEALLQRISAARSK